MPIIRGNKESGNYYQLLKYAILEDARLSYKAKGILAYILGHADSWNANVEDIVKKAKDGEKSVRSGIKELRKYGYITIQKKVRGDGRLESWIYTIHEKPLAQNRQVAPPPLAQNRQVAPPPLAQNRQVEGTGDRPDNTAKPVKEPLAQNRQVGETGDLPDNTAKSWKEPLAQNRHHNNNEYNIEYNIEVCNNDNHTHTSKQKFLASKIGERWGTLFPGCVAKLDGYQIHELSKIKETDIELFQRVLMKVRGMQGWQTKCLNIGFLLQLLEEARSRNHNNCNVHRSNAGSCRPATFEIDPRIKTNYIQNFLLQKGAISQLVNLDLLADDEVQSFLARLEPISYEWDAVSEIGTAEQKQVTNQKLSSLIRSVESYH